MEMETVNMAQIDASATKTAKRPAGKKQAKGHNSKSKVRGKGKRGQGKGNFSQIKSQVGKGRRRMRRMRK